MSKIGFASFKVYKDGLFEAKDAKCRAELVVSNQPWAIYSKKQRYTEEGIFKSEVVESSGQLAKKFEKVYKSSDRSETPQNDKSSRGHTVCMLEFPLPTDEGQERKHSYLFLSDLAGPESAEESSNAPETIGINGNHDAVLDALASMFKIRQRTNTPERKDIETGKLKLFLNQKLVRHARRSFEDLGFN